MNKLDAIEKAEGSIEKDQNQVEKVEEKVEENIEENIDKDQEQPADNLYDAKVLIGLFVIFMRIFILA